MHRVERHWCGRVALNIAMSDTDRASLERIAPGCRVEVVANGVDLNEFAEASAPSGGIAYVGGTATFPNRDALEYFCAEVLPHLRAAIPDLPVWWIGRASVELQRDYRDRFGIHLTGYVADVRPHMLAAACHIVPLRTGGGTRLKILNSWAMGRPVVSTSLGCEGLEAVDDRNILIRDEPKAFAAAVLRVVESESLARRLARGGRATVDRAYSWDAIGDALIATYLSVPHATFSRPPSRFATTGPELDR
jgi:glycosyltransferase involved in cell wall biosynthesis